MGNKYVYFDENTGEILGIFDDEIHNNIPTPNVKITEEQWVSILNNDYNYYDKDNNVFGYEDFLSLEEKKEQKNLEIKSIFLDKIEQGYICSNGIKMDADILDIQKLKGAIDLTKMKNEDEIKIRDYDNQIHTLSLNDVEQMLLELATNYENLLHKKWELQDSVNKCETKECVDSIQWD